MQSPSFLFSFFFFISFSALAQNTATVYGKITDTDKEPLEDVGISILGSAQSPAYTDKKGKFNYTIPANQEVILVFFSLSHKQQQQTVKLAPNEKLEINKALVFNNLIKEVEVSDGNRFKEVTRIDPLNITHIPTASQDFNAILFTLPGVSSRNELSSTYSVRGGNFDENLVYVNGVEIYRPFLIRSGQQEGLSFINPDLVSSVLFSAGGFEAKYGDKMSSVLDVQYRRPRKFASTVSGSFLGSNIHFEGASKNYRFTWLIGSRYKTNQYLLKTLDTKGTYKPFFGDIQAYVTYDITTDWELDFLGNVSTNKYQNIPVDRQTDFGTLNQALRLNIYFDGQEIDRFTTQTYALSTVYHDHNQKWNLKFIGSAFNSKESESFDLQSQYYISELETDFGKPGFGDSVANVGVGTYLNHARNSLNSLIFSGEHKGTYTDGNKQILWGTKYSREMINSELSEWKYVDSSGYSLPVTDPQQIVLQNVIKQKIDISSNRVSGYAEEIWKTDTKDSSVVSLTGGIRANYWDLNKQALVGPRGSIGYKPNWKKDVLFKFSSGYYYQPPLYKELIDANGNVNYNVKAQTSIHYVLSSDYNFKSWNRPFKFITEAYYKQLNNINPYQVDNVHIVYAAQNNAQGYATGMDFKVAGEFVKGLESWASMSIMGTQYKINNDAYYDYYNSDGQKIIPGYTANKIPVDSVRNQPGYIPRPTDQRVSFGMFFQDKMPGLPDLKMHLNLLYATGVPFGPPNSPRYEQTLRMPPYRRVDIGFSYQALRENRKVKENSIGKYFKSIWVSLEVFNLLGINNTVSYIWVTDVTNRQYAVPNYLTQRQLNLRCIIKF
jgi:hypothetical protein